MYSLCVLVWVFLLLGLAVVDSSTVTQFDEVNVNWKKYDHVDNSQSTETEDVVTPTVGCPKTLTGTILESLHKAGSALMSSDPGYLTAAKVMQAWANDRIGTWDGPCVIVFCKSTQDVVTAIKFANQYKLVRAGVRAGGYSNEGYSAAGRGSVLIDVQQMNTVNVTVNSSPYAWVGGGARLLDVYRALHKYQLTFNMGTDPKTGVGEWLGGGWGWLTRKYGLTSERIPEMEVVTPSGSVLTCNAQQNSDLYWALRGGGPGNYAIVTKFKILPFPEPQNFSLISLFWATTEASRVIDAFMEFSARADGNWTAVLHLYPGPNVFGCQVHFAHYKSQIHTTASEFISHVDETPIKNIVKHYSWYSQMVEGSQWNCFKGACALENSTDANWPNTNLSWMSATNMWFRPMQASAIDELQDWLASTVPSTNISVPAQSPQFMAIFNSYGGATTSGMNPGSSMASAIPWKSALFSVELTTSWNQHPTKPTDRRYNARDVRTATKKGLERMAPYHEMDPVPARINEIFDEQPDWMRAYFGDNLEKLLQIKQKYDPNNVLGYSQAVPPGPVVPSTSVPKCIFGGSEDNIKMNATTVGPQPIGVKLCEDQNYLSFVFTIPTLTHPPPKQANCTLLGNEQLSVGISYGDAWPSRYLQVHVDSNGNYMLNWFYGTELCDAGSTKHHLGCALAVDVEVLPGKIKLHVPLYYARYLLTSSNPPTFTSLAKWRMALDYRALSPNTSTTTYWRWPDASTVQCPVGRPLYYGSLTFPHAPPPPPVGPPSPSSPVPPPPPQAPSGKSSGNGAMVAGWVLFALVLVVAIGLGVYVLVLKGVIGGDKAAMKPLVETNL